MEKQSKVEHGISFIPRGFRVLIGATIKKSSTLLLDTVQSKDKFNEFFVVGIGEQITDLELGQRVYMETLPYVYETDDTGKLKTPFIRTLKLQKDSKDDRIYFLVEASSILGILLN